MSKRERWHLIFVAAIVVVALLSVFPIQGRVRLGLDLKGGVHLLLQAVGTAEVPVTDDSIERLIAVLRNRIDQYGITEPVIQRQGNDRVVVDLPGVEDPEAALELIGKTAMLEFRQVVDVTPTPPRAPERKNYDSDEEFQRAQERWRAMVSEIEDSVRRMEEKAASDPNLIVAKEEESGRFYLLGAAYVTGEHLVDAKTSYDSLGRPTVNLKFSREGAKLFDEATAANVGKQIAILLDGVVISAPVVQERISGGEAQISGRFTTASAQRLAIMLRAGALPVSVKILENRSVGPTLGTDSIKAGIRAGLIGVALVVVFMLLYYASLGIIADVALGVTILLLLAGLISLKATLTLPGIAGIILTIGMAVDGNILIYERIREEIRSGKTIYASIDAGFRKAFVTIFDANLTTLIAAAVLYYFGSGPIRGFAVTLSIGIVASVFSAIVVTRTLLRIFLAVKKDLTLLR